MSARKLILVFAAVVLAVTGSTTVAAARPAAPARLAPGCVRKTVELNSGDGPVWHLVLCDGDDATWTVDGGRLVGGAVIIGGGDAG